jgi:hypothetical protein
MIRAALVTDVPGIIAILNQNLTNIETASSDSLEREGFLVYGFTPEELTLTIQDPHNLVLVMIRDEQIIGYVLSYELASLNPEWIDHCSASTEIKALLMNSRVLYHRHIAKLKNIKNIGKALLQGLIDEASVQGYEHIVCQIVHSPIMNQVSVNLHQGFGFKLIGLVDEDNLTLGIYLKDLTS